MINTKKYSKKDFFNKRGASSPEKFLVGIIIILILFGTAPILFGDAFLGNSDIMEGFPIWFIPLILLGLIAGVYYIIKK